jgi:hypothetical protein
MRTRDTGGAGEVVDTQRLPVVAVCQVLRA